MRANQAIIHEAELLASSPERVYQWLEARYTNKKLAGYKYNAKKEQVGYAYYADEELEIALLNNASRLVKLALARYCFYSETARKLWNEPKEELTIDSFNSTLRLCILSNQALNTTGLWHGEGFLIEGLFGSKEKLVQWLTDSSDSELIALFENPNIDDKFLSNYLQGDECWQALDEKRYIVGIWKPSGCHG